MLFSEDVPVHFSIVAWGDLPCRLAARTAVEQCIRDADTRPLAAVGSRFPCPTWHAQVEFNKAEGWLM